MENLFELLEKIEHVKHPEATMILFGIYGVLRYVEKPDIQTMQKISEMVGLPPEQLASIINDFENLL